MAIDSEELDNNGEPLKEVDAKEVEYDALKESGDQKIKMGHILITVTGEWTEKGEAPENFAMQVDVKDLHVSTILTVLVNALNQAIEVNISDKGARLITKLRACRTLMGGDLPEAVEVDKKIH